MRAALLLSCVLTAGCTEDERWSPVLYPELGNLQEFIRGPDVTTIEQCRAWVEKKGASMNLERRDIDYECGKNCRPSGSGVDLYVCKETIR